MTTPEAAPTTVRVKAEPDSRLEQLLAAYDLLKPEADAVAARLKTVTDAIKFEARKAAADDAVTIAIDGAGVAMTLSYVESWRLDATRMKEEEPVTYVRFAKQSGSWRLERSKS